MKRSLPLSLVAGAALFSGFVPQSFAAEHTLMQRLLDAFPTYYGTTSIDATFEPIMDTDGDGNIDANDLGFLRGGNNGLCNKGNSMHTQHMSSSVITAVQASFGSQKGDAKYRVFLDSDTDGDVDATDYADAKTFVAIVQACAGRAESLMERMLLAFPQYFGTTSANAGFEYAMDTDGDNNIDASDLSYFRGGNANICSTSNAPRAARMSKNILSMYETAFGSSIGQPSYRVYLDKEGDGDIDASDVADGRQFVALLGSCSVTTQTNTPPATSAPLPTVKTEKKMRTKKVLSTKVRNDEKISPAHTVKRRMSLREKMMKRRAFRLQISR
jgi:hypothetical protein